MRIKEHDCVVLTKNLPEESLEAGDLGTVVDKYAENDAFVVRACLTDKPKAGEDLWPTK
jgi:hypothetical protein